ncbi:MAG: preprotein translocase subunit SecY [Candidatus Woesearchaeota archaeon]
MSLLDSILRFLPQIKGPTEKKLPFKTKMKWTFIVLLAYFILKHVPLYGLSAASSSQFEALAVILAAEFGSLITLGIGPIVTSSIILQLLKGSGILKIDTNTQEGKVRFQGLQKLLAIGFILVESIIYVGLGGLTPYEEVAGTSFYTLMQSVLVMQLILGGLLILYMDELLNKWGIGSGISLFIAAGVSQSLFVQTFSVFVADGAEYPVGALPAIVMALGQGDTGEIIIRTSAIITTFLIFAMVVWFQSMKVEIPLSFSRVGGYGMRWPLNFIYTSVIPVILIAALLANITILSGFVRERFNLAFDLSQWFSPPDLIPTILRAGTFGIDPLLYVQAVFYTIVLMLGAMVFAWFWMQSAGMDAHSQAKQIMASGLQLSGFRKDPRIIEHILKRYIGPLTIMGGLTVGFLAAAADVTGALTSGTGLLLAVMIVYKFYEDITRQHLADMSPIVQRFMGKR